MQSATFANVVSALSRASVPVRTLAGSGQVAITLAAGRVVALAFAEDKPNVLWSHPELHNTDLVRNQPDKLVGGLGGDRLWFAPELDYHWNGPPRWDTFVNYQVPTAADPGAYRFVESASKAVVLRGDVELTAYPTDRGVAFSVERAIRMTPPPISNSDPSMKDIRYVGIETSHVLEFDDYTRAGRVDLWHLLQAPVGSVLVVPLKSNASRDDKVPLSYGLPGSWEQRQDQVRWKYTGTASAKLGLSARALTGRTGVLQRLDAEDYCLLVRQFSFDENAEYADHPYGVARTDQVFQAWYGLGFGEMEYHSPMLNAQSGPRVLRESDYLWAFGGSPAAISSLSKKLLEVDLTDLLHTRENSASDEQ